VLVGLYRGSPQILFFLNTNLEKKTFRAEGSCKKAEGVLPGRCMEKHTDSSSFRDDN
jgi:hypothetical protein